MSVSNIANIFSSWIIPLLILITLLFAHLRGVKVFESFVEGAKEGFVIAVRLIPFLVAMLVAIGLFRDSGAMKLLSEILSPFLNMFGIPLEILPLALMRPVSGSGALAITSDMLYTYGPDSFIGRLASTMQGSTDTTLFVLTVYFGAIGISKIRHTLAVGLIADLSGFLAAIIICKLFFC
ncbi:MAG: spore maturation protein [Firmicutes bacterium]|nr:spore maturation protein [Bacillota bacterium]